MTRWLAALALALSSACGGDDEPVDAGADVGVDARSDANEDAADRDASEDGAAEDGGRDAALDDGGDAALDDGGDAALDDGGGDAALDDGGDAAIDDGGDAALGDGGALDGEVGDAAADGGDDAAVDAGESGPCDRERFVIRSRDVLDRTTGLAWQRFDGACPAGYHMPTLLELESLVVSRTQGCHLDACAFAGGRCGAYVSSDAAPASEMPMVVDYITGTSHPGSAIDPLSWRIRCVR